MKCSIKKRGNFFVVAADIDVVLGVPSLSALEKSVETRSIAIAPSPLATDQSMSTVGQVTFIKFPGIYEFSHILIKVFGAHRDTAEPSNIITLKLPHTLIVFAPEPTSITENNDKATLEEIEEPTFLILGTDGKDTKKLKLAVETLEPRFVILFGTTEKVDLENVIASAFGATPLKTSSVNIKPTTSTDIKEKFILLEK